MRETAGAHPIPEIVLIEKLKKQLAEFETRYKMASADFYARYERGEMGDAMDFVEWSATWEMLVNLGTHRKIFDERSDANVIA